jgi:hypothetical protein
MDHRRVVGERRRQQMLNGEQDSTQTGRNILVRSQASRPQRGLQRVETRTRLVSAAAGRGIVSEPATAREQIAGWCKHFNGIQHDTCQRGIAYADVRDPSARPYRYPCIRRPDGPCATSCALAEFPTPEEVAAAEAETEAAIVTWFAKLKNGICPHCDTPIAQKTKIGRCVYATPCGCRLYQGKVDAF